MTTKDLTNSELLLASENQNLSLHSSMIKQVSVMNEDDDMMPVKCIDGTLYLPRVEAKKVLAKQYKSFDRCSDNLCMHIPIQVVLDSFACYKDALGSLSEKLRKSVDYMENGVYDSEMDRPVHPDDSYFMNWGSVKSFQYCGPSSRHWHDVNCLLKVWMPDLPNVIVDQLGDYWDNAVEICVYHKLGYESNSLKIGQICDIYNLVDPSFAKQIGKKNTYLFLPLRLEVLFGELEQIKYICIKSSPNPYPACKTECETLLEDFDGLRLQIIPAPQGRIYQNSTVAKVPCPWLRILPSSYCMRVKPNNRSELSIDVVSIAGNYNGWTRHSVVLKVRNGDLPSDEKIVLKKSSGVETCFTEDLIHTRWLWISNLNPGYQSHGDFSYLLIPGDCTFVEWNTRKNTSVVVNVYYLMTYK